MSYTPLKDKMRAAAASYSPLTTILGASPMRWWNVQLRQGATFPAVVVQIISDAPTYAFRGPLPTSFVRVQFTCWDTDPERLETLDKAIQGFIAQYNGAGLGANAPSQSNYVMNRLDGMFPQTQPPQYQRVIDSKIFDNPNV
jgi:hypothetical protein